MGAKYSSASRQIPYRCASSRTRRIGSPIESASRWASCAAAALLVAGATPLAVPAFSQAPPPPPAAGPDWTTPAGTVQGTRFSSLDQINAGNVAGLRQEFEFETDMEAGHEGAPLVVNNTMYVVTPFPNLLFALDLGNRGRQKWVFDPRPDPFAEGKACCDIVNRGAAFAAHPDHPNGLIIYTVLDTTVVAVDAATGQERWRNKLGNVVIGETMTIAPLVVGDKVIVGNSGGEMGVRGFIQALNVADGTSAWKAFTTGPDADVLIQDEFRPPYPKDQGANLGATSWPGDQWEIGGSTVWAWLTYDPELDLLFHGTANPGPWNHEARPGDNKWSSTVFARRPDTGEAIWAYQITPHDAHDYDGVNENIVVSLPVGPGGAAQKVIVRFDRNGFAYVQDAATGRVLSAPKFFPETNWATAVDLATGIPQRVEAKQPETGIPLPDICPHAIGGKDLQPAAFSPRTSLFYVPSNRLCMTFEALHVNYIEGTPFIGAAIEGTPPPPGNTGEFFAWNAVTGTKAWRIPERFPVWSGALVTAGDVVFYGTMDGFFKAVDARSGRVLFKTRLEGGSVGHPMTFLGADGRQRVAIWSGLGGALVPHTEFGVVEEFSEDGDRDDRSGSGGGSGSGSSSGSGGGSRSYDEPSAAKGSGSSLALLPQFRREGVLHVFVLGGAGERRGSQR